MDENFIDTLCSQHEALSATLIQIRDMSDTGDPSYADIAGTLRNFGKLFVEHVYLENKYLYPNIFKNHKGNTQGSIESARGIIEEMKSIQDMIVLFLNKYNTEEKNKAGFDNFKTELDQVIRVLSIRIALEEESIFMLYR